MPKKSTPNTKTSNPQNLLISGIVVVIVVGGVIYFANKGNGVTDNQAKVSQRYNQYWDQVLEATSNPEYDLVNLEKVARGQQLETLKSGIQMSRDFNVIQINEPKNHIIEIDLEDDEAYVYDCVDMSDWLVADAKTGVKIPDQKITYEPQLIEVKMSQNESDWYVTVLSELGECPDE